MKKIFSLVILLLAISSCSDEPAKPNFDKKTIKEASIKVGSQEEFVKNFFSKLPASARNLYWFRNGYQPSDNLYLNDLNDNYETYSVGEEPKSGFDISSNVIVADAKIFTLGGGGEIQARSLANPDKLLWEVLLDEKYNTSHKKHGAWRSFTALYMDADEFLGGSISYNLGTVYGASRRGVITAINSESGKVLWQQAVESPIRSAPTAKDGKLLVTTLNNKAFALDAKSGNIVWSHEGISGRTNISGSPAPLISNGKAIVTYSSGEIFSLDLETGNEVWSTLTSSTISSSANPTIGDIVSSPIIYDNALIFTTSDGRILLLDSNDGVAIWETASLGFNSQPWVVGDFIFAVTRFGDLAAIDFKSGKIVWRKPMADLEDIDSDNLVFTAPIMADGKIFAADNDGTLRAYSPKDGSVISEYNIPEKIYLPPVIAEGTMFLLNNESKLVVMK